MERKDNLMENEKELNTISLTNSKSSISKEVPLDERLLFS